MASQENNELGNITRNRGNAYKRFETDYGPFFFFFFLNQITPGQCGTMWDSEQRKLKQKAE